MIACQRDASFFSILSFVSCDAFLLWVVAESEVIEEGIGVVVFSSTLLHGQVVFASAIVCWHVAKLF